MGKIIVTEDTYTRKLPYSSVAMLSKMLDPDKQWEKLIVNIPRKLNMLDLDEDEFEAKYDFSFAAMVEDRGRRPGASPTRIILDDWATLNVKVKHLIKVLTKSELYAAADYLAVTLLKGEPVPRKVEDTLEGEAERQECAGAAQTLELKNNTSQHPTEYESNKTLYQRERPEDSFDVSDVNSMEANRISIRSGFPSADLGSIDPGTSSSRIPSQSDEVTIVLKELLEDNDIHLRHLDYNLLKHITNNFDERELSKGGNMIGRGGFGTVFIGQFNTGFKIAVKRLKEESEDNLKQFRTELEMLSRYRHENIVHLLGYSQEDPNYCLVYQYMPNGSLEDRLACKNETKPLDVQQRIRIATGTGRGIHYLNQQGLVHRDIKSANVLLDKDFVAKVGDFATARPAPKGSGKTTLVETRVVIGTSAYLAPEAYQFDVSAKLDSYSFGVVLLELLTSLPSYDDDREEKDLVSYVEENCDDIMDMIDKSVGEWIEETANTIYDVAKDCFHPRKKQRPLVGDILPKLEELLA